MSTKDHSGETVSRIESISRPHNRVCLQHPAYSGESDTRGLCGSTAGTTASYKENDTTHGIVRVTDNSDGRAICETCQEIAERMDLTYPA